MTTVTQAVEAIVRATVDRSDAQMGEPWVWHDYDEEGLRFALLMTHHELRDLAVRLAAQRPARTQAAAILAQYHQAYRDLTGVLASVRDDDLDRAPSVGEWPLREMLEHMLGAEHGFLAVNRFALSRHRAGTYDTQTEDDWNAFRAPYAMPKDAVAGTILDIRNAFAAQHMRSLRAMSDITDAEIDLPAQFWEDEHMPIRFRLHRFEEHLRQHTIQLDKTQVAIGRPPTEAHRLVRNLYNALADVEMEPAPDEPLRAACAKIIAERAAGIAG
ncbi:MAG: DinB family protein [Chloroflexota bacterium]